MDPHVQLLGQVRVRDGDSWRQLPSYKTVALLAYLAVRRGWVERIEMATLFWPDADQTRALRNLRSLLARAKREVAHDDELSIESTRVRWDVRCDVHAFDDAMHAGRWQDALALYAGPFMAGASFADAAGFAAWLEDERRRLAAAHRRAGAQHVQELGRAGRRRFRDQSLDAVAATLAAGGHPLPAIRLWAAVDRMREELGMCLAPLPAERRTRAREAAGAAVDRAAVAAAEAAGKGLDAEGATAAAEVALRSIATEVSAEF